MPHIRPSRFLPAILLLTAVFIAFRQNTFGAPIRKSFFQPYNGVQVAFDLETDVELEPQYMRRIVAVGDLHGDYPNALRVLQMADIVDEEGNWSGNVDLFVQTGDIIDRGVDTIKLFSWMEQLRLQARAAGGDVISHLGNHEWMNLLADWRYVYPQEIATFGSVASRQKMLQTGQIGRAWAANYSVTSRIPLHPPFGPDSDSPFKDSKWYDPSNGRSSIDFTPGQATDDSDPLGDSYLSFVHGGLSPTYTHLTPYPSTINTLSRSLLHRLQTRPFPPPHPPHPYSGFPEDATEEEKSLYGEDGPLWYRGWALRKEEEVCGEVGEVLRKTGVRRLVMGHTPNFEHITSRCNGTVIIIDTGISHAYGGVLSALSIQYTLSSPSPPSSSSSTSNSIPNSKTTDKSGRETRRGVPQRWTEREIVTALYPDRQEVLVVEEREFDA